MDYDDDDYYCSGCGSIPCGCDFEQIAADNTRKEREHLIVLSNEDLGKEYIRHSNRHDSAVDRCEAINSPRIEDAVEWMKFIEKEFERRGLKYFDYIDLPD